LLSDNITHGESWNVEIDGSCNVVLDPLTDVGVRMFMPIRIGCGQLMVDILSDGKRSQPQDNADHPQRHSCTE
jgi:hypothetical protein